ncbi:SAM-dependent methyltransferase [Salsipaludibacter albus]|uniref:SAM-dependent methyltransferase n=1 Tax=Salsipaludibacter albus TaxID=2849650 RepID=UPI001EE411A9|nr:cyclopropane-fatty-acyl-phospholipid synthase family protein [Salsipaludibacter albus]MBY5161169.1 cyclopropane-fatty-acyl-phospholipid synthase family protein [Salsipaludibacter albus]
MPHTHHATRATPHTDLQRTRERTLAFVRAFQRQAGVTIPLRLWDGTEVGHGDFRLVLNHPWSLRALLVPATDLNAGEAYLRDDVDVTGDLVSALHAIARLRDGLGLLDRARIAPRLLALPTPPDDDVGVVQRAAMVTGRRHSRARDRDVVRFHYDLGNDFFRCFLDEDLVYSCAYFATPDTSLELAQRRKLDTVVRKLDLRPGERLLDVGCGWGSLVIHAARHFGVHATGVTLSSEQARAALARAEEAGVGDRVEIRVADYREVGGSFDAVASVGMVEHVGSDQLAAYFRHLYGLLADGGRLLNHGITTGGRRVTRDIDAADASFIGRYVFPDGGLVPASRTIHEVEEAGFELLDVQQLRRHYALTLREWVRRLEASHDRAVAAASEVDYRIWRAYMAGSVVGFDTNDLGVVQVLAGRGADVPLDRSFMTPRVDLLGETRRGGGARATTDRPG